MKPHRYLTPAERRIIRLLWLRCNRYDSPYGWTRWTLANRFWVHPNTVDKALREA